jgi:uncharacterized membrane protein
MKRYFLTGLLMLLPFALTLLLAGFVIDFLANPFLYTVKSLLSNYNLLNWPFFIFNGEEMLHLSSKVFALLALFLCIIAVGFLGRLVFVHWFLSYTDLLLSQIPFVNKIYKAFQDIVQTVFSTKGSGFSQVVLAPFPYKGLLTIGFVPDMTDPGEDPISIFLPGSPNPTGGFLLKFKREDLIFTDMPVEEAFKCIISCGVLSPGLSKKER